MFTDSSNPVIISAKERVFGLTSVDDKLFLLLGQNDDQVAVYSINDYQLMRHFRLLGFTKDSDNDMTSCVQRNCLYASNYQDKCVLRYDLSSKNVSKLGIQGKPRGLSVTASSSNLLVACDSGPAEPAKLMVFIKKDDDSCEDVQEIELHPTIKNVWMAVQMTTGHFVLCHGGLLNPLHRVCMVDVEGRVTRSYGGQRGSGVLQLNCPRHLAVDEDSRFIFVADRGNNRIVLLSPTLEFVRYVSEGVSAPHRLYFHHATRRLFVGQRNGDVAVMQMEMESDKSSVAQVHWEEVRLEDV